VLNAWSPAGGNNVAGKFDPGYSFRSSDFRGDRHRRGGGSGNPAVLITAPEVPQPRPAPPKGQKIEAAKPDPGACPGPCNKRYQEAWAKYAADVGDYNETGLLDADRSRPEPPAARFWPGSPVWCTDCTTKIRLRLAQLDTLAGRLAAEADGYREPGDLERVSGTTEPSSQSRAGDDLDEMFRMLSTWEAIYRTLKGWQSGAPHGDLAARETECIDWLRRHLNGILVSGIAADFGLEVLQWHRESCGAAKAGVRTLRKPMRCPSCKCVMLFWTEGETTVNCKNPDCGRILTLSQYETEAERQAAILARGEDLDAELEAS
jgi:hypothetical protein